MEYTEVLDKQITRKQHYVPKAYLKNFSVSNQKSEQVYVVLLMMKMQKWFQSTIFAVVLTYMIKLQLIQIAKLMFLQHQMRSRTVLSNWKANTQQLSQR